MSWEDEVILDVDIQRGFYQLAWWTRFTAERRELWAQLLDTAMLKQKRFAGPSYQGL